METSIRRRLLGVIVVVIVTVIVAEVAVRVAASHLPTPLEWSSDEAQVKFDDLRRLGREGTEPVVFVGSSIVDAAFSPEVFTERAEGHPAAYNAALLGIPMRAIELWTTTALVPAAQPSIVFVGVSCREVNGAESEQAAINEEFENAPAMRERLGEESWLDRVTDDAERLSYLVRYRSILRQPRNFFGRDRREGTFLRLSDSGMNTAFAMVQYPPLDRLTEVLHPGAITRFRLSEEALESMSRLVKSLHSRDIKVVVVSMPVTQDFVSWMPGGRRDHDACVDAIRTTAERAGAEHLDAGVWDRRYFADPIHVNRSGSDRLSTMVADLVSGQRASG